MTAPTSTTHAAAALNDERLALYETNRTWLAANTAWNRGRIGDALLMVPAPSVAELEEMFRPSVSALTRVEDPHGATSPEMLAYLLRSLGEMMPVEQREGLTATDVLDAVREAAMTAAACAGCMDPDIAAVSQVAETASGGKAKTPGAAEFITYIRENYRIGRSTDGLTFAVPTYPGGLQVARDIRSIRGEVTGRIFEQQGVVPSKDAVTAALETLSAVAEGSTPEQVWLRAAASADRVVLDLGDATGRVVVVTPAGWEVRDWSADLPLFRRTGASAPLPTPVHGGDPDTLRDLLGLDATDTRWLLVRGWLAGVLFADVQRPVLWATGPQGSGKSTRARMIMSVIEPVEALGGEPSGGNGDDIAAAAAKYVPSWDNLTEVSRATSNWICRLVTGYTASARTLYTNSDLSQSTLMRTGVATSLSMPMQLAEDAIQRLVNLPFERMPDGARRSERSMWEAYDAGHAGMLGSVLDDVARVLAHLGDVRAQQETHTLTAGREPRMLDYALVLYSLDRALGLTEDAGHYAAFGTAVADALRESAEEDPFAVAVIRVAKGHGGYASLAPSVLFAELKVLRPDEAAWWPRGEKALKSAITKVSEALSHAGVQVEHQKRKDGARYELRCTDGSSAAGGAPLGPDDLSY